MSFLAKFLVKETKNLFSPPLPSPMNYKFPKQKIGSYKLLWQKFLKEEEEEEASIFSLAYFVACWCLKLLFKKTKNLFSPLLP